MEGVMKASFLDTVKTVLWGALGIRRRSSHEQAKISPIHIIIAAIVFVALFIFTLRTIVYFVTR